MHEFVTQWIVANYLENFGKATAFQLNAIYEYLSIITE